MPAAYPAVAHGMPEEGYADQSDAYEPEPEGDYEAESDYEYGGDELEAEPMEEDFGGDFGGVAEFEAPDVSDDVDVGEAAQGFWDFPSSLSEYG